MSSPSPSVMLNGQCIACVRYTVAVLIGLWVARNHQVPPHFARIVFVVVDECFLRHMVGSVRPSFNAFKGSSKAEPAIPLITKPRMPMTKRMAIPRSWAPLVPFSHSPQCSDLACQVGIPSHHFWRDLLHHGRGRTRDVRLRGRRCCGRFGFPFISVSDGTPRGHVGLTHAQNSPLSYLMFVSKPTEVSFFCMTARPVVNPFPVFLPSRPRPQGAPAAGVRKRRH